MQFEQTSREHVVSSVQSYMKEKGVSNENEVYEILEKKVEDAWKHLNHGIFRPFVIPKPLLDRILNLARAPEIFYKGRTDGYTIVNQVIRDKITACIFDPVD